MIKTDMYSTKLYRYRTLDRLWRIGLHHWIGSVDSGVHLGWFCIMMETEL